MPQKLPSKIFLDGANPEETREVIRLLGFLDGQTTNPTSISKNPALRERLAKGEKFTREKVYEFYKDVAQEISSLIPNGSVSIEVYADKNTKSEEIISAAREMYQWIPNAYIKLPVIPAGLAAGEVLSRQGMRLNMTLCFSQAQAAAVYAATRGARPGDVFISPFVARLDERGENGMDLIAHIMRMYERGDGHVHVLTASVRTMNHLLAALHLGSDIITARFATLKEWVLAGKPMPEDDFVYRSEGLRPIVYEEYDINKDWRSFDISHTLTEAGLEQFARDWNTIVT